MDPAMRPTLLLSLAFYALSTHAAPVAPKPAPAVSAAVATPATAATPSRAAAAIVPATPAAKPQVKVSTSMGEFVIELEPERAPKTVENFLKYVNTSFYAGTIFHRVIPGFMVQGGGYKADLSYKTTFAPVVNEGNNGLSNLRGTVAMARLPDPNSASSQFFVNVVDNKFLNYAPGNAGYCVFGRVISGMETVDKIRMVQTDSLTPGFEGKPLEIVSILSVTNVPVAPAAVAAPVVPAPVVPAK
jgi:peptidyl-prolyl cis-trans isomerase A (cyclophilin A)